MSTPKERKEALAASRDLFNGFAALFKPLGAQIYAMPELKPVLDMFVAVASTANARSDVLSDAIEAEGGLVPPPMSPAEEALAKELSGQVTTAFQLFETKTGLKVFSVSLERSADGKINVGSVTVI